MRVLTDQWQKSTLSPDMANCVEVRLVGAPGVIEVRNSKFPEGGSVAFAEAEWQAFIGGVKADEFELS